MCRRPWRTKKRQFFGKPGQHIAHRLDRCLEQGKPLRAIGIDDQVGRAMLDMEPLAGAEQAPAR